jgi:threonine aldolase|eukprot:COSAG06_NODE_1376_length_9648_cov_67.818096_13_plen_86_part_00
MCNEIALRVHCRPGDEVICHDGCHIVIAEAGGPAAMAGVMIKGLATESGIFTAADVEAAFHPGVRFVAGSHAAAAQLQLIGALFL